MGREAGAAAPVLTRQQEAALPADRGKAKPEPKANAEYLEALEKLERAQERMLSSAIAFCDGLISAGQLRAVRELLREQERRIDALGGIQASPFLDDVPQAPQVDQTASAPAAAPASPAVEQVVHANLAETIAEPSVQEIDDPELRNRLEALDEKIARLEQDFQQGRINASQYRAIYRHYMEQREVALRLRQKYPDSDRWQIVLEEGKTRFLLQLNEATCHSVGLYGKDSRTRIFVHGDMPASAEDAMGLLDTFGSNESGSPDGRIFATKTESGETLLLIPGSFTVSLAVFSQDPPAWQVRALREVHRNFEAANRPALQRGDTKKLIFPDLSRFVKD
jgi:hypothetical protein